MAKKHSTTRLVIAGTTVEVTNEEVPLSALRLDSENPRIRLHPALAKKKAEPTQDELLELMREQPGYDELQRQIRKQEGIYEPLMVRHDGRIVEGNTRFAVLSVLSKTPGGAKYEMVPIKRLPADVPERVVQLQMAGYHISGKTSWRAAAKAAQIYRLVKEMGVDEADVAAATRMTPKQLKQNIDAYEYLVDEVIPARKGATPQQKQEVLENKFSHALVLMTSRSLDVVRESKTERKKLAHLIANNLIQGAQVRNLRPVLDNPRAKEALEKQGFNAAKDVLRHADPTAESKVMKTVEKLTAALTELALPDIALFNKNGKARAALEELIEAATNVLDVKEKKRRA